jgi:hypothetical protein
MTVSLRLHRHGHPAQADLPVIHRLVTPTAQPANTGDASDTGDRDITRAAEAHAPLVLVVFLWRSSERGPAVFRAAALQKWSCRFSVAVPSGTCLLFFQTLLLAGYLYAPDIALAQRPQSGGPHLAARGGVPAPIRSVAAQPPDSAPHRLAAGPLAISLIPAVFLLSAGAPMLQRWFAGTSHHGANPASMQPATGSFAALLRILSSNPDADSRAVAAWMQSTLPARVIARACDDRHASVGAAATDRCIAGD